MVMDSDNDSNHGIFLGKWYIISIGEKCRSERKPSKHKVGLF
jgi:hypothetical protein